MCKTHEVIPRAGGRPRQESCPRAGRCVPGKLRTGCGAVEETSEEMGLFSLGRDV